MQRAMEEVLVYFCPWHKWRYDGHIIKPDASRTEKLQQYRSKKGMEEKSELALSLSISFSLIKGCLNSLVLVCDAVTYT